MNKSRKEKWYNTGRENQPSDQKEEKVIRRLASYVMVAILSALISSCAVAQAQTGAASQSRFRVSGAFKVDDPRLGSFQSDATLIIVCDTANGATLYYSQYDQKLKAVVLQSDSGHSCFYTER